MLLHLAVQVIVRLGGLVSGIATIAFLTRGISHVDFGKFSTALTIAAMANGLSDLGLQTVAIREFALQRHPSSKVAGALLATRTAISVVATVGAVAAMLVIYGIGTFWWAGLPVALSLLLAPLTSGQAWAQADLRLGLQNIMLFIQSWLWPVTVAVLCGLSAGTGWFSIGYLVTGAAYAVTAFVVYRKGVRPDLSGTRALAFQLVRTAVPLAISGLFVTTYYRLSGVILYKISGPIAAADYGAGFRMLDALQTLPAALMTLLLPLLSHTYRTDGTDSTRRQRIFDLATRSVLISSLPIAAGGSILAGPIARLLYGASYGGAGRDLSILLWAYPAICLGWVGMSSVVAAGPRMSVTVMTGVVGALNLTACLTLIPQWGGPAAAGIAVWTEWAIAVGLLSIVQRTTGLRVSIRSASQVAAAATAMAGFVYLMRSAPIGLTIPLSAVVYVVALAVTRSVTRSDIEMLRERKSEAATG